MRLELLRMKEQDQSVRDELNKNPRDSKVKRKMKRIDSRNSARMREILRRHGWPGRSLVGEDGTFAAALIVLHAPEVEFKKHCLSLLEHAATNGDLSWEFFAMLTDKIEIAEGRKQLFGTQFKADALSIMPIHDEINVDRSRKDLGLSSLTEYKRHVRKVLGPRTPSRR